MEATDRDKRRGSLGNKGLRALAAHDWDFCDSDTTYMTHGLHPYPAKFIPQIPHAIIRELSRPGEIVADIFCGSGTALVEALLNGRHAVGVDANPLACLISQAKTARLSRRDLSALAALTAQLTDALPWFAGGQGALFSEDCGLPAPQIPDSDAVRFWFEPHVALELGSLRPMIESLPTGARPLAKAAYSSIVVAVSKQDSDTRYVRREKKIAPGDVVRRFLRALRSATAAATEFARSIDPSLTSRVICADVLSATDIGKIDIVVSSPPYPNAYSYHLYHMTRMVWLGLDQPTFKRQEIGSHRKYSKNGRNGATVETFRSELSTIFAWLHRCLRAHGYACFVIGDSILKGTIIHNDELLVGVAEEHGFTLRENFNRRLQDTRKAFNPKIGKIRDEHVVILQRSGGVP